MFGGGDEMMVVGNGTARTWAHGEGGNSGNGDAKWPVPKLALFRNVIPFGGWAHLRESIRKSNDALSDRTLPLFPPSPGLRSVFRSLHFALFLSLLLILSLPLCLFRDHLKIIEFRSRRKCVSSGRSNGIIFWRTLNR